MVIHMKNFTTRVLTSFLILSILCSYAGMGAEAATSSSMAGKITVSSGNLNVRSSASASSSILTKLPSGSYVTLLSQSGGWWYVEYSKGQSGYCSSSYITQLSDTYAAYVGSSLNVRSGPGTSYGVIGWLNSGDYAVVLSSSGTWKEVLFNGSSRGYLNGSYLKTGADYSSISLGVPSFKQTDSRWANTPIASSGGTIGTIGCSTVSLAMSESYRTGTTIYPNDMVKKLSYTSGGAVYWPSNYTTYSGSDYLSTIYSLLKAGKPVLVGSKDDYGRQHWVVVTGFIGGSSLSALGITINDPGSSSRTTLQQYFIAYPNFYKIMYY